ncbi:MAG: citrate/2-methylcitrate synthase [Candidatus Goldiibacteriota bacterium]
MGVEMTVEAINRTIREASEKTVHKSQSEIGAVIGSTVEWPLSATIHKGLEGAIACESKIGYVDGVNGHLVYRGYDCFELSEFSNFEETSYLLIYGKLPQEKELKEFKEKLVSYREVPEKVFDMIKRTNVKTTHPMIDLYMGVGILASLNEKTEDKSVENQTEIAIKLIAQMAALVGGIARLRKGLDPLKPKPDLTHAANLIYMMTGEEPDEVSAKVMDISLILHADHGMNASTFTAMVANSSLSDMYSSIVAGITSLKGSLHGGANEKVLYDLEEIGVPEKAEEWFKKAREAKRKVMGFGHRVYKAYDPRARIFGPLVKYMVEKNPEVSALYATARKLDEIICEELGKEKKIFPNVDFYSGLIYRAMKIETEMFTPLFAASRISGWSARILEYLNENRIFRPRAVYTGPLHLDYESMEKRK